MSLTLRETSLLVRTIFLCTIAFSAMTSHAKDVGEGPYVARSPYIYNGYARGYTALEACQRYFNNLAGYVEPLSIVERGAFICEMGYRFDVCMGKTGPYSYGWAKGPLCVFPISSKGDMDAASITGPYGASNNYGYQCGVTDNGTNPINAATGNKVQIENDYTHYSKSQLEFTRTYNSAKPELTAMGVGWTHNFDRSLSFVFEPVRYSSNTETELAKVLVNRPDGNAIQFEKRTMPETESIYWVTKEANNYTLTKKHDHWEFVYGSNYIELYNESGELSEVYNHNYKISLSHENGRLVSVTDSFGSTIQIEYQEEGLIKSAKFPGNLIANYQYDENNNLVSVEVGGATKSYIYDNEAHKHALTGIVDELGKRFATWDYDKYGRAISSSHAANSEHYEVTYNADGTTTITNPNGKATTYHFTMDYGGRAKPVRIEGQPTSSCSEANTTYSYDSYGFLISKTNSNSISTSFSRDSRGREIMRTEAVGTPQERTITTEWHPEFNLPTKRIETGKVTYYQYDAQGNLLSETTVPVSEGL